MYQFIQKFPGQPVTFASWLLFATPLMLFNLAIAWLWLQVSAYQALSPHWSFDCDLSDNSSEALWLESSFQAVFLCRKSKRKESNPERENIEARDNGIDNNGMEKDDVEAKEKDDASDPKRWSPWSQDSSSLLPFRKGAPRNPTLMILGSVQSRCLMSTSCSPLDMKPWALSLSKRSRWDCFVIFWRSTMAAFQLECN